MNTKEYDDFSDMPGQISKILESFSQSTLEIINQLPALWHPRMLGDFSDTLSSINNLISASFVIDGIADRLLEAVDILNSLNWSNAMRNALDAIPAITASISSFAEQTCQIPEGYIRLSQELVDRLNEMVEQSGDWISLELTEEEEHPLSPAPIQKVTPLVTFDRAVALLGLLLSLLSFVVTQLPNPQLDEQIEQNERLITIQEEQLESERQRTEQLQELAQDLSGIIVELHNEIQAQSQQIEALREQLQDAGDLPEPPAHSDEPSGLDQDADAQD